MNDPNGIALRELAQVVEWMGLRFRVPREWEIVRHGVSPELGSLRFVDRRRERLVVSWSQCRSRPDLGRLVEEMSGPACGGGEGQRFRRAAWRGMQYVRAGALHTHAVSYHASTARLLEVRVFGAARAAEAVGVDSALAGTILEQLEVVGAAATSRRWRAFDLDVTTPEHFALVSAEAKPAEVRFRFERREEASESATMMASAERLGMAESWFDGDFSRLLRAKLPKVKVSTLRSVQHHGSDALALEGRSAETRLARMLGRSKVEKALVWRAREENAVYLVSTRGPLGKAPEPAEFEVHAEARADVAKGEGA